MRVHHSGYPLQSSPVTFPVPLARSLSDWHPGTRERACPGPMNTCAPNRRRRRPMPDGGSSRGVSWGSIVVREDAICLLLKTGTARTPFGCLIHRLLGVRTTRLSELPHSRSSKRTHDLRF